MSSLRVIAITGIGESPLGEYPQYDSAHLVRMAAQSAVDDAGLSWADVDGILTTPARVAGWAMPCGSIARELGIAPRYLATLDLAGASGTAMVHHAAMAIATGQCHTVLCVAGQNLLSNKQRDAAVQSMAGAGWAEASIEAPCGPLVPSLYALVAQRHMHEYATTPEQLAEVAVVLRANAARNDNAHMTKPISVQDANRCGGIGRRRLRPCRRHTGGHRRGRTLRLLHDHRERRTGRSRLFVRRAKAAGSSPTDTCGAAASSS